MPERKNPDTSIIAGRSFTEAMKKTHYYKIVQALQVLGVANYETIGNFLGMRNNVQIARRLKEMSPPDPVTNPKGLNLIFQPGSKSNTKSGRQAYDYQLTGTQPKTEANVEKALGGEGIADISRNIQGIQDKVKQATLFY